MHLVRSEEDILRRIVIAIDGPAGSGKTTTAREVAGRLGLRHIDTGAMYRAVTWSVLQSGVDLEDEKRVGQTAASLDVALSADPTGSLRVTAGGVDVTDAVRTLEVTSNVSLVSSYGVVRKAMVRLQRRMAAAGGAVLEGRDIGSVVLPGADVKVFLKASTEERARRRLKELEQKGITRSLADMRADIERRDRLDSKREISPLKVPVGAHIVDTTNLTIDDEVDQVVAIARRTASDLFSRVVKDGAKNPHGQMRAVYKASCAAIRALTHVFVGLRVVRLYGLDLAEPYIYACNHRSNLDPPMVGSTIRREVHFLAKESLFRFAPFGRLISWYNAIPTRRGTWDRNALAQALETLEKGGGVLVFPEGTRSRGGGLGEGKPGVGYLALQTGVAVVPLYVRGTESLTRAMLRRPGIVVAHGHPIRFPARETAAPTAENCREFTNMVMAAIESLGDEVGEERDRADEIATV